MKKALLLTSKTPVNQSCLIDLVRHCDRILVMNPQPHKWSAFAGILLACVIFGLGYATRGFRDVDDAQTKQLSDMSASLKDIATHLPPQKIVTVEKQVQAPFCEFARNAKVNNHIRDAQTNSPVKGLDVCKHLMGAGSSFMQGTNTYDAIGKWIKTSKSEPDGIEDRIMATVLQTLIYCFENT